VEHLSNNRADAKLQQAMARYERKLAMLRAKEYSCSFCDTMKARIAEGRTGDGEMIAYIDQHGRWDYSPEAPAISNRSQQHLPSTEKHHEHQNRTRPSPRPTP
jgi:hypothetical protein